MPAPQDALPAPLSFADAVALARAHHPEVKRAEAERQQALARRVGAAMPLPQAPSASIAVGRRRDSSGSTPPSTGIEWTAQIGQMLEIAGQRGTRLREVAWAVSVADLQLEEARLHAAAAAALDYLQVQSTEASVAVADARMHLAERVLSMVRDKEAAGATGGLERTLAQVEVSDAQAQVQRAQADLQAAQQLLWYNLGLAPGLSAQVAALGPPPAVAELLHSDREQSIAQLVARAILNRPASQALRATAQGLHSSISRLKREAVPNPTLLVEAQHQQPGQQYFGGGLSVPLPLLHRNQGPRAEAAALLRRNALEQQLFARQSYQEVSAAQARLEAAIGVFATVDDALLPAAQAHADMTVAAWQAGKLDLTRVVQSLRYLAEARQHHTEATATLWRARIELNRVTGSAP